MSLAQSGRVHVAEVHQRPHYINLNVAQYTFANCLFWSYVRKISSQNASLSVVGHMKAVYQKSNGNSRHMPACCLLPWQIESNRGCLRSTWRPFLTAVELLEEGLAAATWHTSNFPFTCNCLMYLCRLLQIFGAQAFCIPFWFSVQFVKFSENAEWTLCDKLERRSLVTWLFSKGERLCLPVVIT